MGGNLFDFENIQKHESGLFVLRLGGLLLAAVHALQGIQSLIEFIARLAGLSLAHYTGQSQF
jgi:hypothetical protein